MIVALVAALSSFGQNQLQSNEDSSLVVRFPNETHWHQNGIIVFLDLINFTKFTSNKVGFVDDDPVLKFVKEGCSNVGLSSTILSSSLQSNYFNFDSIGTGYRKCWVALLSHHIKV